MPRPATRSSAARPKPKSPVARGKATGKRAAAAPPEGMNDEVDDCTFPQSRNAFGRNVTALAASPRAAPLGAAAGSDSTSARARPGGEGGCHAHDTRG